MIRLLIALLALDVSVPANAAIRAIFVGVDKYKFSRTHVPDNDFGDLRGAVADVGRVKDAFRLAYSLDLDRAASGCASSNAVSTTLTDECATRAAIIAAWNQMIDASARGDTLIFYFAGHGSQIVDDQVFDQASGKNDTILPTDARDPDANEVVEILDRETRSFVDRATVKGVNVVTIFDSCHSGTGARGGTVSDGESRTAPPLVKHPPLRPTPPPVAGSGYRVTLAASADDEEAREIGKVGPRAGVFSSALAATLATIPDATFDDIAAEIRHKVEEGGFTTQHPQAEGALRATLRGGDRRAVLIDAAAQGGGVELAAGSLSGVTQGSTFALFAGSTAALDMRAAPLATGTVTSVDPSRALLTLRQAPASALPARLVARETQHAFGSQQLLVRNQARLVRKAVDAALAQIPLAKQGEPAQLIIAPLNGSEARFDLYTADGMGIATLGDANAPDFVPLLRDALQKVARVNMITALRTGPSKIETSFCIDNDVDYDAKSCPPSNKPGSRTLVANAPAKMTIINTASEPRFLYVFGIDDRYGVTLLVPAGGGVDPKVVPQRPITRLIAPDTTGLYRFIAISTDAPINAAALEQDSVGARDPGACISALERALCAASSGTRDPSAARVGNWTATISEVKVLSK